MIAPVRGLVAARNADPGTTVVAGQSVVEVIDPASLWINVRFDQLRVSGLRAGLPVQIVLRSQEGIRFAGRVLRLEPMADAVTEETLAKVIFDALPKRLPPVGELAEVTVAMSALPETPVLPNASVQRVARCSHAFIGRPGPIMCRVARASGTLGRGRFPVYLLGGMLMMFHGSGGGTIVIIGARGIWSFKCAFNIVKQHHEPFGSASETEVHTDGGDSRNTYVPKSSYVSEDPSKKVPIIFDLVNRDTRTRTDRRYNSL